VYYRKFNGIPEPGSLKELWFELIESRIRLEEINKIALLDKSIKGDEEKVQELYNRLFKPYIKETTERVTEKNIAEKLKQTEELLNTPITISNTGASETSFEDTINIMKGTLNG